MLWRGTGVGNGLPLVNRPKAVSSESVPGQEHREDRLQKGDNGLSAPDLSGDSEAGPGQGVTSAAVLVRHWRGANQTEPFKIF